MSDPAIAATPAEQPGGTPPAAPAATPATPATETVTLSKEQHDELARAAARAPEAQQRAASYERILKQHGLLGGTPGFKPVAPASAVPGAEPPAQDDYIASQNAHAQREIMALAVDPAYADVLAKDPTLRDMMIKNPLGVLPVYASEAVDAQDAVERIKAKLDSRKVAAEKPTTPATPPPAVPPAGPVNPPAADLKDQVDKAKANPNTEHAVSGMIGARLRAVK